MAIELLTPFTKVELEPEVKDKKRKQIGILGGNFQPCPQCSFGRGGSGPTTVRLGSGPTHA